jgi:hypothetical protein
VWERNWPRVIPFFQFPALVSKLAGDRLGLN